MHIISLSTLIVLWTECRIIGDETTCWCASGHIWPDTVIQDFQGCLNKIECVANISHYTPLCIPKVSSEYFTSSSPSHVSVSVFQHVSLICAFPLNCLTVQLEGTMTRSSYSYSAWIASSLNSSVCMPCCNAILKMTDCFHFWHWHPALFVLVGSRIYQNERLWEPHNHTKVIVLCRVHLSS